jgi:hypothetical protein
MATTRDCSTASAVTLTPSTDRRTFHQVRALLATAAYHTFTGPELVKRLQAAGVSGPLPDTRWALAMRYAWVLLPGGRKGQGNA